MKKLSFIVVLVAGLSWGGVSSFAEGKEVTIKGEAQCAKCSLHETKECANAIVAKEDGKDVTYYIKDTEKGKKLLSHKEICETKKNVVAKGTVKDVDGKKELTLTSLTEGK
jgi:hypothetical protein